MESPGTCSYPNHPTVSTLPKISARLRRRLVEQRREILSSATHPFEDFEAAALPLLGATRADHLLRAALRRWWIEQVGDLPSGWQLDLRGRLGPVLQQLQCELEANSARPPWIDHALLVRTINVLQRRYPTTLRVPAALRALQFAGSLAALARWQQCRNTGVRAP